MVRQLPWRAILGLLVIPMIITSGFLFTVRSSASNQINGCILLQDSPVIDSGKTVAAGTDFAHDVMTAENSQVNWTLVVPAETQQSAADLKSGLYAACVTIPQGFSKAMVAASHGQPNTDTTGSTLVIDKSPVASNADADVVAATLSAAVTKRATGVLTSYLDQVYVTFDSLGGALGSTKDAAATAASAAKGVSNQVTQVNSATTALAGSLNQAAQQADQMVAASTMIANTQQNSSTNTVTAFTAGSNALVTATTINQRITQAQLASLSVAASANHATGQTQTALRDLTDAVKALDAIQAKATTLQTSTVTHQTAVADFTGNLSSAVTTVQQAQSTLSSALGSAKTRADSHATSVSSAVSSAVTMLANLQKAIPSSDTFTAAASALKKAAATLKNESDQLTTAKSDADAAFSGVDGLSQKLTSLEDDLAGDHTVADSDCPYNNSSSDSSSTAASSADLCAAYQKGVNDQAAADLASVKGSGLSSAISALSTAASTTSQDIESIQSGYSSLSDQLNAASDAVSAAAAAITSSPSDSDVKAVTTSLQALKDDSTALSSQVDTASTDANSTSDAIAALAKASSTSAISASASDLVTAAAQQTTALTALQTSMATVGTDVTAVGTIATTLGAQANAMTSASGTAATSGSQLTSLLSTLRHSLASALAETASTASSSTQIAGQEQIVSHAIDSAKNASSDLVSKTSAASQSAHTALQASNDVASQTVKNATAVPNNNESQRQKLRSMMIEPISTRLVGGDSTIVEASGLITLALWLGALSIFSVFPAVSQRSRQSSRRPLALVASTMAPGLAFGAAQAVVVGAVAIPQLGLSFGRAAALGGFLLIAGAAFAAMIQALVAWLGNTGRVIAIAAAVVTSVVALTSAAPEMIRLLQLASPLTPVLWTIRALLNVQDGLVGYLLATLAWFAVGALFTALAILRKRVAPAPRAVPAVGAEA